MSDARKNLPQLGELLADPRVRRWTIGGAIVGFVVTTTCLVVAVIADGKSFAAWEWPWLVIPAAGTLNLACCGLCLGYLDTKSKRRDAL